MRVGLDPMGFCLVSFEWAYLERSEASSGEFERRDFMCRMCIPCVVGLCSFLTALERERERDKFSRARVESRRLIKFEDQERVRRPRSVLHPWSARNLAAVREVDTHVSSILTMDPSRRE